jgi:prepilin-type processing-associated H-X9-DG protein
MKLRCSNKRNQALTQPELVIVVVIVFLMFFASIYNSSITQHSKERAQRINCVSNLRQINLALRIWEGDNHNNYPMSVSVTNHGGMELIAAGNIAGFFQVMSNELVTPKILVCPADMEHYMAATNFAALNNSNISYFINLDASEAYPQEIMSGDANLAIDGIPVKSGLITISPSASISWTGARHRFVGNIGYADGSVSEVSTSGLQSALVLSTNGTPVTAIRLAIP